VGRDGISKWHATLTQTKKGCASEQYRVQNEPLPTTLLTCYRRQQTKTRKHSQYSGMRPRTQDIPAGQTTRRGTCSQPALRACHRSEIYAHHTEHLSSWIYHVAL